MVIKMSNQITEKILNLREEIAKYVPLIDPKPHTHSVDDLDGVEGELVPTNHAWDKEEHEKYGIANQNHYGHVAISNAFTSEEDYQQDTSTYERNKTNAVSEEAVRNWVMPYIAENFGIFCLDEDGNLYIETIDMDINLEQQIREIVSDYDINSKLEQHVITNPKSTSNTINNITENGYYFLNPNENEDYSFICNNDVIHYERAFIIVKKQYTRIIQYVYATIPNSLNNYQLTGDIYIRIGSVNNNIVSWNNNWKILYKSYTIRSNAGDLINSLGDGVSGVELYENTAGYTFKWNQSTKYTLTKESGIWATICTFKNALPIEDNFIFSNIINNTDIKISSTKVEIRSKQRQGTDINEIHETHFIPRK